MPILVRCPAHPAARARHPCELSARSRLGASPPTQKAESCPKVYGHRKFCWASVASVDSSLTRAEGANSWSQSVLANACDGAAASPAIPGTCDGGVVSLESLSKMSWVRTSITIGWLHEGSSSLTKVTQTTSSGVAVRATEANAEPTADDDTPLRSVIAPLRTRCGTQLAGGRSPLVFQAVCAFVTGPIGVATARRTA